MTGRRVCVVVSARPSYSRVKTALLAMQSHPTLDLQVVVTASALLERYGGIARMLEEDGLRIAARAATVLEGHDPTTMATSTGLALLKLVTIFENLRPDVVVTIADRYETLATATAAAYMNIPLAHLQGGEVTGSVDEKVRHAVTKLADLHLVSTARAAQRVIAMGEDPKSVFVTGCPSIDLAVEVANPSRAGDLTEQRRGTDRRLDLPADYVVVLQHPVTTECEQARAQMLETLHALRDCGVPAVIFHPNDDAGSEGTTRAIEEFRTSRNGDRLLYLDSLGPTDFLRLIHGSSCLVGNSSVGIREGSYLGVPVVNVGTRQKNRERAANVIDVAHDRASIAEALRRQLANGPYESDTLYGSGRAGERIASILTEVPLHIEKYFSG
jgi:UDP-hydrolysing UDP-N-acetyl-D-glucosamine 2-epimerase